MATRPYEQRRRAESTASTRQRILDAVFECLRAAPTGPLSVERVAREAGVARSTVYLDFGSRAGLFEAATSELMDRGGFGEVLRAVAAPDARQHLRGGIRGGVRTFARDRDVHRVLHAMAAIDPEGVGEALRRTEHRRAGGMAYLAERLAEQHVLRPDVGADEAAHVLWVLTSFESFDLLYTGRGLGVEEVADVLVATAERALWR